MVSAFDGVVYCGKGMSKVNVPLCAFGRRWNSTRYTYLGASALRELVDPACAFQLAVLVTSF
jgi:hypothetical protein